VSGARRRRPATRRLAFAAALALLAAGCLSRPAPPDRLWRLELAAPAALPAPALPGVLEVERFAADAVLQGTALVWRSDAAAPEVHTLRYDRWVDSPTLLLQQQLAAGLRAAGLAREVVTPELRIAPDHRLGGRLLRLEELRGPGAPRVAVEIEIAVTDARRAHVVLQATYLEEREVPGGSVGDVVRAYDAALSAVLARLAVDAAAAAQP
jgi:cholesterol transport system auxiliary component